MVKDSLGNIGIMSIRNDAWWLVDSPLVSFYRYLVPGRKGKKFVSMYAVLTSRKLEGRQVAFFNPS